MRDETPDDLKTKREKAKREQPVLPVVAIGASVGGVKQIQRLFDVMPEDTGAAFVSIMHLDPDHRSEMAHVLRRHTKLEVVEIEDGMELKSDRVHIVPAGCRAGITGNTLRLTSERQHSALVGFIDIFFRELAAAKKNAAIGIVLSGSGSDGANGAKAIKAHGGLVMVQSPESADFDGMPQATMDGVAVDFAGDTPELAEPLCNHLEANRGLWDTRSSAGVGAKDQRLFQRIGLDRRRAQRLPRAPETYRPPLHRDASSQTAPCSIEEMEKAARNILLREHVPAAVVVNRKLEILCSYGPVQDYFTLPLGETSLDLMDMVHDAYRDPLRAVVHRAFRDESRCEGIATLNNTGTSSLRIVARPLQRPALARGMMMVTFEPIEQRPAATSEQTVPDDLVRQLYDELDDTRRELQTTIQALEASNEDLKSSNEEILSMNEELETSKEELQTEHKQTEEWIRQVKAQFQLAIDAVPLPIAYIDRDDRVRLCNTSWRQLFSAEGAPAPDAPLKDWVDGETREAMQFYIRRAFDGRSVSGELDIDERASADRHGVYQVNYTPHIVDDDVLGCYLIMSGGSRQSRLHMEDAGHPSELVYLQRMATLGELTSTLAHDMRQPLAAINAYAGAVTRMMHNNQPVEKTAPYMRAIADQVGHATDIVDSTREFVGRRELGMSRVDFNSLVNNAMALTEAIARKVGVEIRLELGSPLADILCSAVQIEQVVVNLIINAYDAMESIEPEARKLHVRTFTADDDHVQLTISDSGEGIPIDKIGAIFDAFYTSKLDGMGMGLALCRSITENHDGRLWAESAPGKGATFHLKLPTAQDQSAPRE
ncbi:chemotaxis protein CheB [Salinisphaera sp.]|uniref:chemotaxis protein CheB n=1 Tax=Salinisphaera sp. TaxID=1914330 RepID=UPI002D78C893|nr:chemotaxis protein CheB [Salinisphaera sp.]HET7312794.1 chemotaxis protein CheB [Salinisphaera sp.]